MSLVAAAFFAGLLGSPHCVGMCGPFAASCTRTVAQAGAWHAGRLGTYGVLGAAAGAVGGVLAPVGWLLTLVAGALTVGLAASLAGWLPPVHLAIPGVSRLAAVGLRRPDALGALTLGAASGLLPCGLVYAALAVPVASADPVWGAGIMVAFGMGTLPLLATASVGLHRLTVQAPWTRKLMAAAVLITGLWSLTMRQTPAIDPVADCE